MVRQRSLIVAVIVAVIATAAPAAAAAEPPDFSDADAIARATVAEGQIPGIVFLVGRGDEILHQRAFGARAIVPDVRPMTTDTIFDISSVTKPLGTTLAVMSLVERGAVSLDAPIGRYLREFKGEAFRGVTIRRLLTHSAGFRATPPLRTLRAPFPKAARAIAAMGLDYAPGSGFEYSDTGFLLLAEMVRRVSGAPLDRYLERTVFRPLGLHDTWFHPPAAVRARIAPTQWGPHGEMLQGVVHDPSARALGGVAGNAGMFTTAADMARICQMLLRGGVANGHRVLKETTIHTMWARSSDGNGTRALGWDVASVYAPLMLPFFPAGSVGHTGYTGTMVWLDPSTRVYLIVLTNRVHPSDGAAAEIRELRRRLTAAVGAAMFRPPLIPGPESPSPDEPVAAERRALASARLAVPVSAPRRLPSVVTGLDTLVEDNFAQLAGYSVGLVTNQTGIDAHGRRAIDLLASAPGVRLQAIFSPEHGIGGDVDAEVPNGRDAATGRTIWSLYGSTRRPTSAMLKDVNLLVFDIQDVGTRYYTYLATLVYVMEEAARHGIPVIVLDRPDPITGRVVEGPLIDPDLASFTAVHSIPVRTGMTIGEFARMAADERRIPVSLTVIPLRGWDRERWYDDTGLPWVNPSPNIRSLTQALLYSGIGLLESTNLSVGRGTDTPFEVVGAPWIEPVGLAEAINALGLRGVHVDPVWFTPTGDHYARQQCAGVRFVVTDRDAIRPVTVALALARELRARHRDQFRPEGIQNLLVSRSTMWAFLRGEPLDRLLAWAGMERSSFLKRRASYLIYP